MISLTLCFAGAVSCANGLKVKVYYSMPNRDGLYRKQENELVLYRDSEGYRCLNPSDWEAVLNYMKACKP